MHVLFRHPLGLTHRWWCICSFAASSFSLVNQLSVSLATQMDADGFLIPPAEFKLESNNPRWKPLGTVGVSKSHNLGFVIHWSPWYFFCDFVRAPNGRGKKSKSKTARISRCFSVNGILTFNSYVRIHKFFIVTKHQLPRKKHWCVIMWWSCGDGFGLDGFGSALDEARKQPKVPKKATSDCPLHIATLPYRFADPWRFFFVSDISLHKKHTKTFPDFWPFGLWVFIFIFLRMLRWRFRWLGHCCLPKSWRLSGWWPRKLGGDPLDQKMHEGKSRKKPQFSLPFFQRWLRPLEVTFILWGHILGSHAG